MPSYLDELLGGAKNPKTLRNVKSPDVASRLKDLFGDYSGARASGKTALADYVSSFYDKEPAASKYAAEESANIDRYFSGQAASELGQMRNRTYSDALKADDLASKFLLRDFKSSVVGQEGMPSSSYFARAVMPSLYDIQTRAALGRDAAERADWSALENTRLGLTGARTGINDRLLSRSLMPWEAENRMLGANTANLAGLSEIDRANTFYGLKNRPGPFEGFTGDVNMLMDSYGSAY